jgi:hypothetical protein
VNARRKKAAPHAASESSIYSGRELAGTVVVERKGRVMTALALDATGKRLGTFATGRAAMAAILAAARSRANG